MSVAKALNRYLFQIGIVFQKERQHIHARARALKRAHTHTHIYQKHVCIHHTTVDSRYLEFQGTL